MGAKTNTYRTSGMPGVAMPRPSTEGPEPDDHTIMALAYASLGLAECNTAKRLNRWADEQRAAGGKSVGLRRRILLRAADEAQCRPGPARSHRTPIECVRFTADVLKAGLDGVFDRRYGRAG